MGWVVYLFPRPTGALTAANSCRATLCTWLVPLIAMPNTLSVGRLRGGHREHAPPIPVFSFVQCARQRSTARCDHSERAAQGLRVWAARSYPIMRVHSSRRSAGKFQMCGGHRPSQRATPTRQRSTVRCDHSERAAQGLRVSRPLARIALRAVRPATLQACSPTASKPYKPYNAKKSYSPKSLQTHSPTVLQPYRFTALHPYSPASVHSYIPASPHPQTPTSLPP